MVSLQKMASSEHRRYPRRVQSKLEFVVFSDDWGRWPSSSQHLFRYLAQEHRVLWVETVGMRRPRLSAGDLQRSMEKIRSWVQDKTEDAWAAPPEGLHRIAPPMHPWFGTTLSNEINDRIVRRAVKRAMNNLGMHSPVLVTTIPTTAGLVGELGERSSVYYRVDDFSLWPGYPSRMIQEREQVLLQRATGLLVSAQRLRCDGFQGPQAVLDHGVDIQHFACPSASPTGTTPPALAALRDERPLFLFAGRIDERIDFSLLQDIPGQVVLLGRQVTVDIPPHISVLPAVSYDDLPSWLAAADALLLPYRRGPLTDTIQPLKLREYLATGRPIVSSSMPEVIRTCGELVELGDSPATFRAACERALNDTPPRSVRRSSLVAADTWAARADELLSFIETLSL